MDMVWNFHKIMLSIPEPGREYLAGGVLMFKEPRVALLVALAAFILPLFASCGGDDSAAPSNKVPVVTTGAVSSITQATAQCGGTITSDGGAAVTARGVCWSTNQTPTVADNKTTDGTGTGSFTSSITGLTADTPYYERAYVTNSVGTGYGSAMSFMTRGAVTDIDGNVYQTVTIGTQVMLLLMAAYITGMPYMIAAT